MRRKRYERGRDAVVSVLLALSEQNERLQAQVEQLTVRVARQDERIATLERQLGRSSRNSSQPPGSDPPGKRRARGKDRSGRAQGAQMGHAGHGRELLAASAVDEAISSTGPSAVAVATSSLPESCCPRASPCAIRSKSCRSSAPQMTEHRAQRVRCPGCGRQTRAVLPAEVSKSAFGPRLQAAVGVLSARNRVSRRDAAELVEGLFGARICAGTVDAILTRTADALERPYEDLLACVRENDSVNMDETGWRLKGAQRTLWGMFTARHAVFHVTADRHADHAKELLAATQAIVTSDRWWAYSHLPLARRQLCWSHLRRDFTAHAEGLAAEKEFGEAGLALCERVFWAWEIFVHTHDPPRAETHDPSAATRIQAYHPLLRS